MPAELTAQDWDFRAILRASKAELIAGCWYEYARESLHVRTTMEEWLRLEKPRVELFQRAEDQNIELKDLEDAFLYFVQDVRLRAEPDRPRLPIPNVERNDTAAKKLLSGLSDKYREVVLNWHAAEKIESYGDIGVPRVRFVAKHLVEDRPWPLIPKAERDNAIANAFKSADSVGFAILRTPPPVERVDELVDLVCLRKAHLEPRLGEELVFLKIGCRYYNDNEIVESFARSVKKHRPKEWKRKAKDSGRRRLRDWWRAALKELAAMRLAHVWRPFDARYKFLELGTAAKFDESNFRKLQRNSIKTFRFLFRTREDPRHAKTWAKRRRRG